MGGLQDGGGDVIQKGDRIRLIRMGDDPDPIAPGATGEIMVTPVEIQGIMHVSVKWDPEVGRSLSLCIPPDEVEVIPERRGLELDHHTVGLRVRVPAGTRTAPGTPITGVIEGKKDKEFLIRFDVPQQIGETGFFRFDEVVVIS